VKLRKYVWVVGYAIMSVLILTGYSPVHAQSYIDTLSLVPLPPDSIYVRRAGSYIVVGWYPKDDSISAGVGTRDFSNWYISNPDAPEVDIIGYYIGDVDRTLIVQKVRRGSDTVGYEPSIEMLAEIEDLKDTYRKEFDIGTDYYTPGDTIDLILIGAATHDTLDIGLKLVFHEGIVDTAQNGMPAYFTIDLQDFEGFHIWRGLSPYPSDMQVIAELSKEDAYLGFEEDSLYFLDWPKYDAQGKKYYEFRDTDVFAGFTYFYTVTTYDRGYFKGHAEHNKRDSYICEDENLKQWYEPPYGPRSCESTARVITMTVDTGTNIKKVYAVPNPYRSGTSAQTSPYYHNFPDGSIKFFNVPKEADIKVYTVSGDLVWEAHHSDPTGENGIVSWDTKNKHGEEVSSGVYIFRCESSTGESVYGRIVIIR